MTLIRMRNRLSVRFLAVAAAIATVFSLVPMAYAAIVFDDTFGLSTMNRATNSPTATSTNYDVLSAKSAAGSSIASGDLKVAMASTSGAIVETQALFASTPVTLANNGDFIEMTAKFTNTLGISTTTGMQLDFGLLKSGGVAPKNTLNNSGLSSGLTTDATSSTQNWTGYSVQLLTGTTSSKFLSRPVQTGPDNTNQDVLTNNASSSQSYHNPAGTQLGSSSVPANITLTGGATYTEDLKFTLTSPTTYSLSSILTDSTNTVVSTFSTNATPALLINSFDALAIGWRITGTTTASTMDVGEITVATNVAVPEISSFLMAGAIGVAGVAVRRIRRRESIDSPAAA